jgi:hypothetical protein
MKQFKTFEEFLNESYSRRFGNFQVALSKEKINLHWADELNPMTDGVKGMIEHFGKTPLKEIAVIFEKDVDDFDILRSLVRKFGVMGLFGMDTKEGRFCVLNSNS